MNKAELNLLRELMPLLGFWPETGENGEAMWMNRLGELDSQDCAFQLDWVKRQLRKAGWWVVVNLRDFGTTVWMYHSSKGCFSTFAEITSPEESNEALVLLRCAVKALAPDAKNEEGYDKENEHD